ncbi:hypothetical protein ICN42_10790 [Polynucleobacter sp. 71A-WALBACH]|uniref:hypothetical protein n=1 Tax=Polynucleobacter sp. 71A-WALBACH TaxID=2689097 RepID=UPI001C0C218A|nr:hypothetical protein [Polynucleobacter sp. 71A-WALBACH]MBU3594575.1 hypothetical protein [Polynucleobacter sp. 71A-WALBACH]
MQIPSEVLNSAAYKDLSYSARAMLVEALHFYRGNNNGSIYISAKTAINRGLSKNTMTKAIKELIAHGFIYQTRRGGSLSGVCSLFAITWKPINRSDGQFLNQFVSHAYRNWSPALKKNEGSKIGREQAQKWECPSKKTKPRPSKGVNGNTRNTEISSHASPIIGSYLDMPYIQLNNPLKSGKTYPMNWMALNQKRLNQMELDNLRNN